MKNLLAAIAVAIFAQPSFGQSLSTDAASRTTVADRIQQVYGITIDPATTSLGALIDAGGRLSACRHIKDAYGVDLDYRDFSLSQFTDVEIRIAAAQRINRTYELNVKWQEQNLSKLIDLESKLSVARPDLASKALPALTAPTWHFASSTSADSTTQQLETKLTEVLNRSASLSSVRDIRVNVEGSDVVLRGSTASEREARLAENLLRLEPGVRDVRNELKFPTTSDTGFTSSNRFGYQDLQYSSRNGLAYYDYYYRPLVGEHYVPGYFRNNGSYVTGLACPQKTGPAEMRGMV